MDPITKKFLLVKYTSIEALVSLKKKQLFLEDDLATPELPKQNFSAA